MRTGFRRYFTPDEATAILPRVARILDEAHQCLERARSVARRLEQSGGREDELHRLESEVHALVDRIRMLGVEVKALDPAVLDFPALRNGREVWLSWIQGETEVAWWRPIEAEAGHREPVASERRHSWEWCN